MPARRSTNRFLERELARVLRAAQKSGVPFDRIEVDPVSGNFSVVLAKPGQGETQPPGAAAWDKATEELEAKNKQR
jgi:hypothetical protein